MPDFETPLTLAQGDSGDDVTLVQQFLIALELDPGPQPNGVLDNTTSNPAVACRKIWRSILTHGRRCLRPLAHCRQTRCQLST